MVVVANHQAVPCLPVMGVARPCYLEFSLCFLYNLQSLIEISVKFDSRYEFDKLKQVAISIKNQAGYLTAYLLCIAYFLYLIIDAFNDEFTIHLDADFLKQQLENQNLQSLFVINI